MLGRIEDTGNKSNIAKNASDIITACIMRYESENTRPGDCPQDRTYIVWFRRMLLEIGQQIKALRIDNIETLDSLFKNIYIPFTVKYGIIPKISDFCLFTGINPDSIYALFNNNSNNKARNIINSWYSYTERSIVDSLIDSPGSNINSIFILKACYGYSDTPKQEDRNTQKRIAQDRNTIIAELSNVENPGSDPAAQDIVE